VECLDKGLKSLLDILEKAAVMATSYTVGDDSNFNDKWHLVPGIKGPGSEA
jgi:hypothetical protein